MKQSIQAEKRSHLTRSGLRQLRQNGRLPSIVYGKHVDDEMIHISIRDFNQWAKQGYSGVVELDIEGSKMNVMLEAVQHDPITRDLIHADFMHVRMDEAVRSRIPLEFVGTPAGVKGGGILHTQATHVEVECLPKDLPTAIVYDISHLDIGESATVEQLSLPSEVTLVTAADELLVSVLAPRVEQADEDAGDASTEAAESAEEEA